MHCINATYKTCSCQAESEVKLRFTAFYTSAHGVCIVFLTVDPFLYGKLTIFTFTDVPFVLLKMNERNKPNFRKSILFVFVQQNKIINISLTLEPL